MAVVKMKRITIVGNVANLDRVTEACGRSGIFHPDAMTGENENRFKPIAEENPYEGILQKLIDTMGIINKKPKLMAEEKIRELDFTNCTAVEFVDEFFEEINPLRMARENIQKVIGIADEEIQKLKHFADLDEDLHEIFNAKFIKVRFGSMPKDSFRVLESKYRENPYVKYYMCADEGDRLWGLYLAPLECEAEIDNIFGKLYFQRLRLRDARGTPAEIMKKLELETEEARRQQTLVAKRIQEIWEKEELKSTQMYSWLLDKHIYFSIRKHAYKHDQSFVLTGWVPEKEKGGLIAELGEIESVSFEESRPEEEIGASPPVRLKNSWFTKPYEFFVEMYGLPNYREGDPTILLSILFTILFGIMFADLGQGIVVAAIGHFLMWKMKKMQIGRILVPCGLSAAVFGTIFGSIFGFEHALNPLYHMLGFAEKPVDVMNGDTVILLIAASIGVGVLCISIAMLINIIISFKRKKYARAVVGSNGIAALVFYLATAIGAVVQMLSGVKVFTGAYVVLLILLPLAMLFLQEIIGNILEGKPAKPEKIGEYFTQSFFELFEILLSLMSNTVSFLRVGAFILVHSGMMMMVMTLAEMVGEAGSPGFIAVVIFGNIFVTVLETLLVCIHVLRLQYYEMFSRFYDGDGKEFRPIKIQPMV
jgi:Archaeal/vacuolar-type H+-ATPase subunit I